MKHTRFFTILLLSVLLPLLIQAQQSDPYEKGQTGEMTLWVSSADPNYGIYAYDYDNDREMGQYDGSWKTYPTISIGEYEITSKNLLLHYRDKWSVAMGWVTNSQATINQMNREYNGKDNVSLGTFNDINGSYVTLYNEASSYRNAFKIYNKARTTQLPGWDLISSTDFFQMFGQAPAITGNPVTNIMNFLGANKTDVPADYTADWFEYKNTSGFTMTPLGRRHSNQEGVAGQKWFGYKVESTFRLKDYPTGMILFNRNTGIDISSNLYHFSQARYSRPKTDQELGYKIYIDNCNDSVVMYPLSKVTKLTELPKGLERGIVLRYANREHMKVLRKWSQIRQEADLIRQAIPAIPAMAPLAVSPCEEPEPEITPDPYSKGKTSSVLINIGARGDGSYGLTGWNYDTQKVEQSNVITKTYKTIEASEYQWTTENLRLKYGIYASINMNWVNLTQGDVDKFSADYLGGRSIPLDEFEQVYGTWATLYDVAMMYRNIYWGVPKGDGSFDHTWGLPTKEDIWQLYGQTPRKTNNLYEDIKEFLFASSTDFNFGWTGGLFNRKNVSGLTLTPLGMRESYQGGAIYGFGQVTSLQTSTWAAIETLSDRDLSGRSGLISNPYSYHFTQARHRRPLTDEELGYRLYIDAANDAVIMLPYTQVSTLPELPKGLERGIALRYANRKHLKVLKKWSKIKEEADLIKRYIAGESVIIPIDPLEPTDPVEPVDPIEPLDPIDPLDPSEEYCENAEDIIEFTYDASGNRIKKEIVLTTTRSAESSQEPQQFLDEIANEKIIIYPNPTRGQLMVEIPGLDNIKSGSLTVFSLMGQTITKKAINQRQTSLDISNSPAGTYILHININGKISTWKIIKQ